MGERYHVLREVSPKLLLAEDVESHAPVALKVVDRRQVASPLPHTRPFGCFSRSL